MTPGKFLSAILLPACLLFSCQNNEKQNNALSNEAFAENGDTSARQREILKENYPSVPHDELFDNITADKQTLYQELQQRYKHYLSDVNRAVTANSSKLIVVVLTPEVGSSITKANAAGIPFILQSCRELNIECVDLSPALASKKPEDITQVPVDGHWSEAGSKFIAQQLASLITKYGNYSSNKTYSESERPRTFGDLEAGEDHIADGEKNLPYHVQANAQGLRMNNDLSFPKTKQRILLLGDSQIFSPFLDNDQIFSSVLQQQFPDKEILNAGIISYTIEDYLTLYLEKARFAEPDLVIMATNGGDVTELFFSHRNLYSRSPKAYEPTALERKVYKQLYGKVN